MLGKGGPGPGGGHQNWPRHPAVRMRPTTTCCVAEEFRHISVEPINKLGSLVVMHLRTRHAPFHVVDLFRLISVPHERLQTRTEATIVLDQALNKVVRQPIRSQPAVKWIRVLKGADLRMAGASQVLRRLEHAVTDGAWLGALSAPVRTLCHAGRRPVERRIVDRRCRRLVDHLSPQARAENTTRPRRFWAELVVSVLQPHLEASPAWPTARTCSGRT